MKILTAAFIFFLTLAIVPAAIAGTDGAFTPTSPNYGTENAQNAFDEIKENFEWIQRHFLMDQRFTGLDGYYADYTYTGDELTGITVKDSFDVTQGVCTLTYSGGYLSTEVWAINGKTLTYTYTYSAGKLTRVTLAITTP
ncbi:MAG: hypothetical protein P8013_02950 [Candidatus Sulfobium sp.]|jgi:hypothetical protein